MIRKSFPIELLLLSTAIGLVATFAAPWPELRGSTPRGRTRDELSRPLHKSLPRGGWRG